MLSDFECCDTIFEELFSKDEIVLCPKCQKPAKRLVSRLADYTGVNSMAVQYTTGDKTDSYITKAPSDHTFLSKSPVNITPSNKVIR